MLTVNDCLTSIAVQLCSVFIFSILRQHIYEFEAWQNNWTSFMGNELHVQSTQWKDLNLERAKEDISQIIQTHRGKGHICRLSCLDCCILQSHAQQSNLNKYIHLSQWIPKMFLINHGFLLFFQFLTGSHYYYYYY